MDVIAGGIQNLAPEAHPNDNGAVREHRYAFKVVFGLLSIAVVLLGSFSIFLYSEITNLKNELHKEDTYVKAVDFDQRFLEEFSDMRKIMYSEIENQNKAIKGNVTAMDVKIVSIDGKVDKKMDSEDRWDFEITTLSVAKNTASRFVPLILPFGYSYKECKFLSSGAGSQDGSVANTMSVHRSTPYMDIRYSLSSYPASGSAATGVGIALCNKNYLNPQYVNWPEEYQ